MSVGAIDEAALEASALQWFMQAGYAVRFGPDIVPGELGAERERHDEAFLPGRLRDALAGLNPDIPAEALDDAYRKITLAPSSNLIETNDQFHQMLVDGIDVQYRDTDDRDVFEQVRVLDFADPDANDWLVVNQFSVVEDNRHRRADVVVFVNGLPLAVLELKSPTSETATTQSAYNQLQTYRNEIPALFHHNEVLVVSDGMDSRAGTLTGSGEWFLPWKTVEGDVLSPPGMSSLEVLIKGIFEKRRFLDLIRSFIVFESDGVEYQKKMALYHQYHAVNKAVESAVAASSAEGDGKAGVVWHTQGSGKSLSMVFFAGKLIQREEMANPTVVVITDRIDLDSQLFGVFSRCQQLLRQRPEQAGDREHLKDLLRVPSGGVVFTTLQKFLAEPGADYPCLSDRRNVVVICDEAHRSQYDFLDGLARHMRDALPNASFIAFTGTPIQLVGKDTVQIFGDYLDVYDIRQAVEDKATVPIYYEGRLIPLDLSPDEEPLLDEEFDDITEDEEDDDRARLRNKWSRLEQLVGAEDRVKRLASDLVAHFEQRLDVIPGKGMVVCMSRRICVDLYNEIVALRPDWHSEDDAGGSVKVVMTGSASDPVDWQQHIGNKARREDLAKRFKDPGSTFRLAIVRDMWLTGFDAPPLHTMYVDKPMQGHGLMQTIARVNRVYPGKPGGLIVDYLGIAAKLKQALDYYSSGDREAAGIDQSEAVAQLLEKLEIVRGLLHGFDYSAAIGAELARMLPVAAAAIEYVLGQHVPEGDEPPRKRLLRHVKEISAAFALAVPDERALDVRDEVRFLQLLRTGMVKLTKSEGTPEEDIEAAIQQMLSRAVVSGEVIDIFSEAGLERPDISVLSDEFLREVQGSEHKNIAAEALRKLLEGRIRIHERKNPLQARSFAEMLKEAMQRYHNRAIEAAEVIEELLALAHEIRDAEARGEQMGLSDDELAFYDALAESASAVEVMGDEQLMVIARELLVVVRENATIDWAQREAVRAKLRVICKRILRKHGYPPDLQQSATETVLEQAELLCEDWVGD